MTDQQLLAVWSNTKIVRTITDFSVKSDVQTKL